MVPQATTGVPTLVLCLRGEAEHKHPGVTWMAPCPWRGRAATGTATLCGRICGMLRWLTAGESHGQQLTAVLDGLPAGVEVQTSDLDAALARRRLGHGRGARMSFEQDEVTLTGGREPAEVVADVLSVLPSNKAGR